MLLEHERNNGLGMDALVTVCSWNTKGIMVWAWMLLSPYALGTRTELCTNVHLTAKVGVWGYCYYGIFMIVSFEEGKKVVRAVQADCLQHRGFPNRNDSFAKQYDISYYAIIYHNMP